MRRRGLDRAALRRRDRVRRPRAARQLSGAALLRPAPDGGGASGGSGALPGAGAGPLSAVRRTGQPVPAAGADPPRPRREGEGGRRAAHLPRRQRDRLRGAPRAGGDRAGAGGCCRSPAAARGGDLHLPDRSRAPPADGRALRHDRRPRRIGPRSLRSGSFEADGHGTGALRSGGGGARGWSGARGAARRPPRTRGRPVVRGCPAAPPATPRRRWQPGRAAVRRSIVLCVALASLAAGAARALDVHSPDVPYENFPYDGEFTFARIKFEPTEWGPGPYYWGWDLKWNHDYPWAEQNFMKILEELTAIRPN